MLFFFFLIEELNHDRIFISIWCHKGNTNGNEQENVVHIDVTLTAL